MRWIGGCALALAAACVAAPARAQDAGEWRAVEQALGKAGTAMPGGVMRFAFPRDYLGVAVDSVTIRPAFALGSWIAFLRVPGGGAMAMGDLVLAEDEVGPVIARLEADGVEVTALHNHLLRETPRVMYLHVQAHGDPARIASAVHAAMLLTRTPMQPPPPAAPASLDLDTAAVARALGHGGRANGGVYQVSVPRRDAVREHGEVVPAAMGVATAINFQPTGNGRAAITGDFVMTADEVNPVVRALRAGGIEVTALHSHMLGEEPRLYFMHFWANDDAVRLAGVLRSALGRMAVR